MGANQRPAMRPDSATAVMLVRYRRAVTGIEFSPHLPGSFKRTHMKAAVAKKSVVRKAATAGKKITVQIKTPEPVDKTSADSHGPSSPDLVVEAIKQGIVLGRIVPGQRLIEADMTRDHRVSRGPVREALKRLAAEGVVSLSRHRGAYIRLLTRREVIELLHVVQVLISLGVRLASLNMKPAEHRARLKAAFDRLSEHGPIGDRGQQSMDRNGFYEAIFSVAGNRELERLYPVVLVQILRMQVYPYLSVADRKQQFADYKVLYDAIRAGKSLDASRRVTSHVRRSRMQIRKMPDEAFAAD